MADDDRKDDTKEDSGNKKTPVAEAARARTTSTRRAAQKPAKSEADAKTEAGARSAQDEDQAAADAANAGTETGPEAGGKLSGSTAVLAAVFILVILVVALIAWPGGRAYVAGLFSGPEEAQRAELAKRLGALEAALQRIETDIAALKAAGSERAALDKRVTALESRPGAEKFGEKLEQSEKRLAGLAAKIEALDARMAKTEAAQTTGTVALMALAGALRTGAPFAGLSARVTAEAGGQGEISAALTPLAPFAEAGVPTVVALMARLESLEVPAGKAPPSQAGPLKEDSGADAAKPAGFWDKVKSNVMKLGRVRKSPDKPATAPAAATVRAATAEALVRGDLIAAAEAAKVLPGDAAGNWRRDLEARIKANAAARALDLVIAARLGPAKGQR